MSTQLEICIDSIASARAAKEGGADRLEVCSALAVGGTTPSFGLVEQCVADLEMNVMMMIRPHDGGFVYDEEHVETMLTDIEVAKSIGVQGVVFGALTTERAIDLPLLRRLVEAADSLEITFHRAFDLVVDPIDSLRKLEQLGVQRILTSGQQRTAISGAQLLRQLTDAAGSISVLAGSGVNADNVQELVKLSQVKEVHASGSVPASDCQSLGDVSFGETHRLTCSDKVRAIKQAIS